MWGGLIHHQAPTASHHLCPSHLHPSPTLQINFPGSQNNGLPKMNAATTCECAFLHGKRDFANVVKLRILRQGCYFGLCKWVQYNHKCPYKEWGGSESEKEMWQWKQTRESEIWRCCAAGIGDGGRSREPRNTGSLQTLGKSRKWNVLESLQKGHSCPSTVYL